MTQVTGTAGRSTRPVLITDATLSPREAYERRRRRYGALMAGRVLCVIGAFVVGTVFSNVWLAGLLIAGAAALPWAAVLIANDRLPEERRPRVAEPPSVPADHQLTSSTPDPSDGREHRVIEM